MTIRSELRGLVGYACHLASRGLKELSVSLLHPDDGHMPSSYLEEPTIDDVAPHTAGARDFIRRKYQHLCWLALARATGRKGRF